MMDNSPEPKSPQEEPIITDTEIGTGTTNQKQENNEKPAINPNDSQPENTGTTSSTATGTPGTTGVPTRNTKKGLKIMPFLLIGFVLLFLLGIAAFGVWYIVFRDNGENDNNPSCTFNAQLVEDTAISNSDNIKVNSTITKEWQVKNTGSCEWNGDVKLVFTSGDTIGSTKTVTLADTAPNALTTVTLELTAPAAAGNYQSTWGLKNNNNQVFGEKLPIAFTVQAADESIPKADLVITELTTSAATVRQGSEFYVTAKIKNQGGQIATDFKIAWRACDSDACPYLTFPDTVTLAANEEKTIQMAYTYTTWSTYKSDAKVDSTNHVNESDENNNTKSLSIPVSQGYADLVVDSISFSPSTPISGQDTTITITYKNTGYRKVTQNVALKWWQSTSAPTPGCTIVVSDIDKGETKTATCHYTFPSWYPSLTTRAQIDTNNEEVEVNENNNTLTKNVTVSAT